MLTKAKRAAQTIQHLGPRWTLYRAGYALQQKSGRLARQLPATPWTAQPLASFLTEPALAAPARYLDYRRGQAPAFFFDPAARSAYGLRLRQWDEAGDCPQQQADKVAAGTFRYFDHLELDVGCPPDWHKNALTGERAPSDMHWSRLPDFGHGDIKVIWEPSRFGFTYALVRAYWRSGDERYADCFWRLVEDWRHHNPPQQGVNWKCGQETSLRVMAWCFGLYGFLDAPVTTPDRVAMLAQMIAVSGQRIEANLGYALSQRNNHGISEGMGLWTIGLLFPEFTHAERWQARGRQVLEQLATELIYEDGSFVQHSVNYHRLMLHDYIWALRLGELHAAPLSDAVYARVAKAGEWLHQIMETSTGRVPWYGQTDGAHILPLTNCDYLDMRPVVQATHYATQTTRAYPSGPWDESLLWLFGPAALAAPHEPVPQTDLQAQAGGYYTLRNPDGFAFMRCAAYRDRPGQADMLHVDLWHKGQCIAGDAGTFSYNAPAPWNNPLAGTTVHNTVVVDGLDQMDRAGKFLWLPWVHGQVHAWGRSRTGLLGYWQGEHDGYTRLPDPVRHRRAVISLGRGRWLILDHLRAPVEHAYRLHWLLHVPVLREHAPQRTVELDLGAIPGYLQILDPAAAGDWSLVCGDDDTPRGWHAPYYQARQSTPSLAYTRTSADVLLGTWVGPHIVDVEFSAAQWRLAGDGQVILVDFADPGHQLLVRRLSLLGADQEEFDPAVCIPC